MVNSNPNVGMIPSLIGCYHKACRAGKRLPEVEACILTSVMFSYHYALDVIKGRWIEAEDVIMTDTMYSYDIECY